MKASDLIYDWNLIETNSKTVKICDETLRDGLQGNLNCIPSIDEKLNLLIQADNLGVSDAVLGFPAQEVAYQEALKLCQGVHERNLKLRIALLGRIVESDIEAIADIQQNSGHPVIARLVIGCSPIRRYVETHDVEELEDLIRHGFSYAQKLGVPTLLGMEDTTRSEPEVVERLFLAAVESGAEVLSICDTVGYITPIGTERVVKHFRKFLDDRHLKVRLDFHGHNDRGLGVANALAAIRAGIDSIDCTVLGIGERAGNIPLDLLLVNLKMAGIWSPDISNLNDYCQEVARVCQLKIPPNYPIFGNNAFSTQAGLHASAIMKAEIRGETDIAALVYSGVDPHLVGLDYDIEVGPHSGRSNVRFVLHRHNLELENQEILDRILEVARSKNRILTKEEVYILATSFN